MQYLAVQWNLHMLIVNDKILLYVTLRWDIPVVCHKYHKNEVESQSEHN